MQWHGVVDAVGNARLVQFREKIFSVVYKQRVLGVGARVAIGDLLRGEPFDVGEEGVVALGDGLACLEFCIQVGELDAEDGGLQGVEPAVHAGDFVEVALFAAVVCEHARFLGEFLVRGEDGPAVTVAAEGLARVEAGDGDVAEGTCLFPALRGPEGLRGIFEEPEPVTFGDLAEFCVWGALAEEVDRDDSARQRADQGFDAFGGHLEGARVDVGKNGGSPEPCDTFCRGDKGEIRNDDLVPRLDAEGR